MGIYRTTNPAEFDDVDGIIINESAPSPNIAGVAANIAILVGVSQRGGHDLTDVGSIGEFHEVYGKSSSYGANVALKNKKFGRLKFIRVEATSSVKALKAFASTAVDRITFTALHKGVYGNLIKVTIENGTTAGKKYTIQDLNTDAVLPTEVYDDVVITAVGTTFANSNLVSVVVNSSAAEPTNAAATALATGADGAVADGDYEDAIAKAEVEAAGNVMFLDTYNAVRNGYLEAHASLMQDKMVVLAGLEDDDVADAVTDVANFRDADGRIIYAFPWVKTTIDGADTYVNPASFMVSVLSQTAPNIDPAYAANTQFLGGVTGLKLNPSRANYISLKEAGIAAFEYDSDIGYKIKSGIVTQISNSSKIMIARRRMADYLTASAARFLKNYQNAPNTKENRTSAKGAMMAFIQQQENEGILPRDSEVTSGVAKLVDTESLNTDATIAAGYFKILWKQRIQASMRFIIIQAEIGESVVVTEGE